MRGAWLVAALVATAAHAGQAPAQDTAKGASLLAEARKALGGEDKLAAIKRLEVKGESRRAQGNQSIEGDLQILIELPDKYLRKEELMLGGNAGLIVERVEALNGTDSWEKTDGGNFRGRGGFDGGGGRGGDFRGGGGGRGGRGGAIGELLGGVGGGQAQGQPGIDPERLREAQRRTRQADFSRLLLGMLLVADGSVAWIGTAQSPDGTADVLEITPQGGQPMRLLLDTATHMPLMMTWQGAAPRDGAGLAGGGRRGGGAGRGDRAGRGGDPAAGGRPAPPAGAPEAPRQVPGQTGQEQARRGGAGGGGQQATLEMHFTEYKVVNGIKLPHVITRGSGDQTTEEFEIKSYKINPNFKANTFIQDK